MRNYETNEMIVDLVIRFETAAVNRDEWKHAEHLIVALYYSVNHDLETATAKMRSGIFRLLESFGVDLTKEMPYHETITVFWMRTVYAFAMMRNGNPLAEKAAELVTAFDKDYPLRFYTRELLFSDRARAEYVDPDLFSSIIPSQELLP